MYNKRLYINKSLCFLNFEYPTTVPTLVPTLVPTIGSIGFANQLLVNFYLLSINFCKIVLPMEKNRVVQKDVHGWHIKLDVIMVVKNYLMLV